MTDFMSSNIITDLIRTVLVVLIEKPAYGILKVMYEIFFNIATAEILSSSIVKNFYYRIQLIIGIIMIFKLSITVLQSIISPEKVTKQNGMMSIIGRVFIVLVLLTVITPINVKNPKNKYEEELSNNGILFGTLYSLQYRILDQNTLGKLVLGSSDSNIATNTNTTSNKQKVQDAANRFASSVLKIFVKINVVPKAQQKGVKDGQAPEDNPSNWACTDINDDLLKEYRRDTVDPEEILNFVNLSCSEAKMSQNWRNSKVIMLLKGITKLAVSESYAFAYFPVLGGIVAYVLSFILLGFSIDIAIRAVKLAALRLIAPIPIIGYINPSKDNGAFGAWVKNLTSTYLDLFIRLAVVYFVLNIIGELITGPGFADKYSGFVGGISYLIIVIGLFIFAREAPKFLKDAIGIKGTGSNIGLSALLGGAAMVGGGMRNGAEAAAASGGSRIFGALRGGATGFAQGALNGERGAVDAYNQNKQLPLGSVWSQNRDLMEQIRTGDKDAHGGMIGRLQDRLNYRNRDRAMEAMGMGKEQFARAEWWKDKTTSDLAAAQDDLKTKEENLSRYMSRVENGAEAYNAATYNRLSNYVTQARRAVSDAEVTAGKAAKNAEKIEKYRAQNKADPRIYDTVHETYRSDLSVRKPGPGDPPLVLDTNPTLPNGDPNPHYQKPTANPRNFESKAKDVDPFKGA